MAKDKDIQTCVTFLTRKQVDYLDRLGKDSLFKYGHKLPRTKLLSELVELLKKLDINLSDINLKQESLSEGILRIIKGKQKADV